MIISLFLFLAKRYCLAVGIYYELEANMQISDAFLTLHLSDIVPLRQSTGRTDSTR